MYHITTYAVRQPCSFSPNNTHPENIRVLGRSRSKHDYSANKGSVGMIAIQVKAEESLRDSQYKVTVAEGLGEQTQDCREIGGFAAVYQISR